MAYNDYELIVRQEYEGLKTYFINYLRANFRISHDDAADIYADAWIDIRRKINEGSIENKTKLKALLFKIGWRQADKICTRRPVHVSIDDGVDDGESFFSPNLFEAEKKAQEAEYKSIYEDPDLQQVLAAELSYIPDPCNKILKLYYFDEFSMKEIAQSMNYKSDRTAITTKQRCFDKLKNRVLNSVRRLGLID